MINLTKIPDLPGVYAVRNLVNGKLYVGSAVKSVRKRLATHRQHLRGGYHPNKHMQLAWDKYGEANFEMVVLVLCRQSSCLKLEQRYMDANKSFNKDRGYNLRPRAENTAGFKMPAEVVARQSARNKERYKNPEERKKSAIQSMRMWKNPATRERITASLISHYADPTVREEISKRSKKMWANGKIRLMIVKKLRSKEARERNSKSGKRTWRNATHRNKMVAIHKRRCLGKGVRDKLGRQAREYFSDPQVRKNKSEEVKLKWQDPEHRAKMAEAHRRRMQNPKERARLLANSLKAANSKKSLAKVGAALRVLWATPEWRAKMMGVRKEQGKRLSEKHAMTHRAKRMMAGST